MLAGYSISKGQSVNIIYYRTNHLIARNYKSHGQIKQKSSGASATALVIAAVCNLCENKIISQSDILASHGSCVYISILQVEQ